MQQTAIGSKVLAWVVLPLCIFAYAQPYPPAWWWVVMAGCALAGGVVFYAWSERNRVLADPLSIKTTVFVITCLALPLLVLGVGLTALVTGSEAWLDAAIVLAIALACTVLI
jgi:hypothetical protein